MKVINTKANTYLRTDKQYNNFILECDCKIDSSFNTCIMFRCSGTPDSINKILTGYQVKIDPTPRKWTGGIFAKYDNALHWLYTLENDERARESFKINEWNHFRIEAIDNNLKVWVNDIPTCNLNHSKYSKGHIVLKIHGLSNEPDKAKDFGYFKSIRIITQSPEEYRKDMDIPVLTVD